MTVTTTPHHVFTPGCTLDIRARVVGERPVRLLVQERRHNPNGTITAWGRVIRKTDGELGRHIGATLGSGDQYQVFDNPHDEVAAGVTTAGRSYSLARKGSSVLVWGDLRDPKEMRHVDEDSAAGAFRVLAAQLSGAEPATEPAAVEVDEVPAETKATGTTPEGERYSLTRYGTSVVLLIDNLHAYDLDAGSISTAREEFAHLLMALETGAGVGSYELDALPGPRG
ncbi:hypothetical protein JNW90_29300 [Micromonospora sp. STR1s_5]|nr:hypothetical protein [Micromonospora sp. STR1s_5]